MPNSYIFIAVIFLAIDQAAAASAVAEKENEEAAATASYNCMVDSTAIACLFSTGIVTL